MVRSCLLFLISWTFAVPIGAARPSITVSIQRPQANEVVHQSLLVSATVQSTFDIDEVHAGVDGRDITLTFDGSSFVGTMSMNGIASGNKVLTVTATDVFGDTGSAERAFILDRLPMLAVELPIDRSVTRALIEVSATCTDEEGACELTVTAGSAGTLSGTGSVTGTFDLSGYDGGVAGIGFTARDSRDQQVTASRLVYVESSPYWLEAEEAGGQILDADPARILFATDYVGSSEWREASVLDRKTGATTTIPLPAERTILGTTNSGQRAYLTTTGAIFVSGLEGGSVLDNLVYDWNEGELLDLGHPNSSYSLAAAGGYAT